MISDALLVPPGFALTRKTNSADFLTDPCGVIYARIRPRRLRFRPPRSTQGARKGLPSTARASVSGKRDLHAAHAGGRGGGGGRRRRRRGCKSRRKMSRRCDTRYYPPPKHPGSRNDLTSPTFAVAPFRGDKKRRDGLTVDKIISGYYCARARECAECTRMRRRRRAMPRGERKEKNYGRLRIGRGNFKSGFSQRKF